MDPTIRRGRRKLCLDRFGHGGRFSFQGGEPATVLASCSRTASTLTRSCHVFFSIPLYKHTRRRGRKAITGFKDPEA